MNYGNFAANWGGNWQNWGFESGIHQQNSGNPPAGGKSKGKAPQAAGYYGRGSQWSTGQASPPPQPVSRRNHNDPSNIIATTVERQLVQQDEPLRPFQSIPLEPFSTEDQHIQEVQPTGNPATSINEQAAQINNPPVQINKPPAHPADQSTKKLDQILGRIRRQKQNRKRLGTGR